ncbi:FAD binding domain-containing protein [Micrococcales bacterium KH10]|nr:FAD binding domain-containing protein [Micrococcales bacterium KH10]
MVDSAQGAAAATPVARSARATAVPQFSRKRPYHARIAAQQRLTSENSSKEVWRVGIQVDRTVLTSLPGDTLGVLAPAPEALVDGLLDVLGYDGTEPHRGVRDLRDALTHHLEVSIPSPRLLRHLPIPVSAPASSLQLPVPDVLDLFQELRDQVAPATLLGTLRPAHPRAFSISSYPTREGDTLDLTVARLRETHGGRVRHGIASEHLVTATPGATVEIFPVPNPQFRLPDDDRPVIMIAAGTGIAPFRGFLQQMAVAESRRSWLIFGDRARATDFLYQDELTTALHTGVLTRLDLAFSRDGSHPRYVQHAMVDQAADIIAWLSDGARIYVCGHGPMARGVELTLGQILDKAQLTGTMTDFSVPQLQLDGRYVTDVYDT